MHGALTGNENYIKLLVFHTHRLSTMNDIIHVGHLHILLHSFKVVLVGTNASNYSLLFKEIKYEN